MTAERSQPAEKPELPMFAPNPDLVIHLEGNKKWEKWFKDRVREAAEEAKREWEEIHGPGSADKQRQ